MTTEHSRRSSLTDAVEALFRSSPNTWLTMQDLAKVGGIGGWRSRVSDCRRKRHMQIEHNGKNGQASRHRFIQPAPLDLNLHAQALPF